MSHPTLHTALVEVTDGLSRLPNARLIKMRPHPQARDSFIADVQLEDIRQGAQLRPIAEQIYQHIGALVLFHRRDG